MPVYDLPLLSLPTPITRSYPTPTSIRNTPINTSSPLRLFPPVTPTSASSSGLKLQLRPTATYASPLSCVDPYPRATISGSTRHTRSVSYSNLRRRAREIAMAEEREETSVVRPSSAIEGANVWPPQNWQDTARNGASSNHLADTSDFQYSNDEQMPYGLPSTSNGLPQDGFAATSQAPFDFDMANAADPSQGAFNYGESFDASDFVFPARRPSLALETEFNAPESSVLPANGSGYDPERLETPQFGDTAHTNGMTFPQEMFSYGDPQMTVDQLPEQPQMPMDGIYYSAQPMYFAQPDQNDQMSAQATAPQEVNTISPEILPHQQLHMNKSFGDIMMDSRNSSSSGLSTGDNWSSQGNALRDWHKPMQAALGIDVGGFDPSSTNGQLKTEQRSQTTASTATSDTGDGITDDNGNLDIQRVAEQVDRYLRAPNRLAHGERSIIVMTPKVAQKSYGTEKRYLCPQPQAVMLGKSWWTEQSGQCPASVIAPPIINISLIGEEATKDLSATWIAANGEDLTERINADPIRGSEDPLLGKAAGRNLHISNQDGKRRNVYAQVSVEIPGRKLGPHIQGPNGPQIGFSLEPNSTVGVFDSKEIKVISKPSKKKSNTAKAALGTGELNIIHGSTVSLFNRVRAQSSSTRYLAVEPKLEAILGSDGRPFPGVVESETPPQGLSTFTADPATWESFIIWLVDPSRSSKGWAPPMQQGYPHTPVNAILSSQSQHPICYNNTVILQSLTTGVMSPTLVVRRVEQASVAIGADGMGESKRYCPPGECQGDPVSQLHKIALEIYTVTDQDHLERDRRYGGEWLVCINEQIKSQQAQQERKWANRQQAPASSPHSRPASLANAHDPSLGAVATPAVSPISSGSSLGATGDYFSGRRPSGSTINPSPRGGDIPLPLTESGPVRRQRTHSSGKGPLGARPLNRKRSSAESVSEASGAVASGTSPSETAVPRQSWAIDVSDIAVWSIVSTEQTMYTFFIPPNVKQLAEPVTPIADLTRFIPPGQAAEVRADDSHQYTSLASVPLVTYYGHGFRKGPDGQPIHRVFYGSEPASHNEYRCGEVIAAAEPSDLQTPQPVSLVRADGQCIFPTTLTYPRETIRF